MSTILKLKETPSTTSTKGVKLKSVNAEPELASPEQIEEEEAAFRKEALHPISPVKKENVKKGKQREVTPDHLQVIEEINAFEKILKNFDPVRVDAHLNETKKNYIKKIKVVENLVF